MSVIDLGKRAQLQHDCPHPVGGFECAFPAGRRRPTMWPRREMTYRQPSCCWASVVLMVLSCCVLVFGFYTEEMVRERASTACGLVQLRISLASFCSI